MLGLRRLLRVLAISVLAGALLYQTTATQAQTSGSSGDMTDLLRNLTPEQQDAIMNRLGMGGGGLGSGPLGGTGGIGGLGGSADRGQGLQRGQSQEERGRIQEEGEEPEPLIPVLKGEDWVIIEADFHLPPRQVSPSLQALQSLYTTQGVPPGQNLQALQAALAASGTPSGSAASAQTTGAPSGTAGGASPSGRVSGGNNQTQGGASAGEGLPRTEDEAKRLRELIELIRSKNPYQLSRDGALVLPGFAPMPMLGLTDEQASLRLSVEPAFRDIEIRLTRLPLKKTGAEALKPFGYELFERAPSTFAPVTNVPVPADYVVGPGDELDVQLYGSTNRFLRLFVGRDGQISFPELGPISVGGQRFNSVKATLEARVARQMIGVHANVSMGETRTIRVFVLGEARRPGSYTISGLGTITSALFAAGGVKRIGSLRNIELKRQGEVVRRFDLYDLLIRGDTTDDAKLLQGDVIFVPTVGTTVGIEGEVRRPAIYEIKREANVRELVQLAGGLTPQADAERGMLTRINADERRVVLQVSLSGTGDDGVGLRNGDVLRVMRLKPTFDSAVLVQGHLYSGGAFAYRSGMHLSDVIHSIDELRPDADQHYVLIRRERMQDRHVSVLSADLAAALAAPGSPSDPQLQPRDRITVFDLNTGRDRIIQPLMEELRRQSSAAQPSQVVHVDGTVKVPGDYPLEPGMTVADLVRAGGGLADAAYGGTAELTRYTVATGGTRRTDLVNVDLDAVLRGDSGSNLPLKPFDSLSVKQVSQWEAQESVTLRGEVRFPGRYAIKNGETLRSVIDRAGGLTEYAFPQGSVFTRETLRKREQEQIDFLAQRMETDLATLALQGAAAGLPGAASALPVGQSLLGQLRTTKAVGRLVVDLLKIVRSEPGSRYDVVMRNGDELTVPKLQQQVTVIGEVQSVTSHLYSRELRRDDYIALSGGMTRRADPSKIYVVRANGSVVANGGSRWFGTSDVAINPGDTIVVPLNTQKMPPLPFWQAVTSIVYNVAIAAAAVHALR